MAGHFVLFTYLTSYAAGKGFDGPEREVLLYTVFGLSGVIGGLLAGTFSDLAGRRVALIAIPTLYIVATIHLASSQSSVAFLCSLSLWAAASWSISPTVQSYLIGLEGSPRNIVVGANTTAMHLGVAIGAVLGGRLLAGNDISILPAGAAGLAGLALMAAIFSIKASNGRKFGSGTG